MSKATEIILTTIATYMMFKLLDKIFLIKIKEVIRILNNVNHYVFCEISWGKITTAIIGAMPVYYFVWIILIPIIAYQFKHIDKMEIIITSDIILNIWIVNYVVFSLAMTCGLHQVLEERHNADRPYLFEEGLLGSLAALMLCLTPPLIITPVITLITIKDIFQNPNKRSKNTENDLSGHNPDKNPDIVSG